jgi:creatinine amidohydrolase
MSANTERRPIAYEDHTWEELAAAAARDAVVILPLGAIEQHGPHLPVSTDAFLARRLPIEVGDTHDVVVGPSMPLGYRSRPLTGGGPHFPGTISLCGATFTAVVRELVAGILAQGFRSVIVYVWHMENQNFAYEGAYLAAAESPDVKVIVMESPFSHLSAHTMEVLYGGDFPGWGPEHAGILETSLMLYLDPRAVDMSRAVDDGAAHRPDYDIVPAPPRLTTRSGALGRTRTATEEKGCAALADIADYLRGVVDHEFPQAARAAARTEPVSSYGSGGDGPAGSQ